MRERQRPPAGEWSDHACSRMISRGTRGAVTLLLVHPSVQGRDPPDQSSDSFLGQYPGTVQPGDQYILYDRSNWPIFQRFRRIQGVVVGPFLTPYPNDFASASAPLRKTPASAATAANVTPHSR